jgi:magnesium transporter
VTEILYGLGPAQRERIAALRAEGSFFWLDVSLSETSVEDLVAVLDIPLRAVPALATTDEGHSSRTFHTDGESVVFVFRCYVESAGADAAGYRMQPVRVQLVVTGDYLVTLHEERISLPAALAPDVPEDRGKRYAVYSVLDAILTSSFDALDEVQRWLDELAVFGSDQDSTDDGQSSRVTRRTLRVSAARLATLRRWVGAEEGIFRRATLEIDALPGFDKPEKPTFDSLVDQLGRLVASVDAAGDGAGMLLDLQLNERAYVVSVIATIFVPMTFITGYFGMNFKWMTDHVESPVAFWLLGAGVPALVGFLSWRLLVRGLLMNDRRTLREASSRPRPQRRR